MKRRNKEYLFIFSNEGHKKKNVLFLIFKKNFLKRIKKYSFFYQTLFKIIEENKDIRTGDKEKIEDFYISYYYDNNKNMIVNFYVNNINIFSTRAFFLINNGVFLYNFELYLQEKAEGEEEFNFLKEKIIEFYRNLEEGEKKDFFENIFCKNVDFLKKNEKMIFKKFETL